MIRHAIAHLHGPSILAGVRRTGAEHLNWEPPTPTPATPWTATGGGKPKLSGSTLSHPELQPHLGKSFCYISVAPLRDQCISPSPRVPSKCAWWHLLSLLLLDCATPSFGLSSSCAGLVFHGPRILQPQELFKYFHSFWNTFSVPILVSLAFWFVSFIALFTCAPII